MSAVPTPEQGAIPVRVLLSALDALKSARLALCDGSAGRISVLTEIAAAEGALRYHVNETLPQAVPVNPHTEAA